MMTTIITMLPQHSCTEEQGALPEARNGSDLMPWKVTSSPCGSRGGEGPRRVRTDLGENAQDRRDESPSQRLQFTRTCASRLDISID